jgi:hypothetical protein
VKPTGLALTDADADVSPPTKCAWPASLITICQTSPTDELRTGSLIKDAGTEMLRAQPEAGLKASGGLIGWLQDPPSGVVADRRHGEKWAWWTTSVYNRTSLYAGVPQHASQTHP